MSALAFTVPGRVMSWQRPSVGAGGRVSSYARGKKSKRSGETIASFKKCVQIAAQHAIGARAWDRSGIFAVELCAYYESRVYGDIDRIPGNVLDALQGLAFDTDRQVGTLAVSRRVDKDRPRVEVTVVPYDESADDVQIEIEIKRRDEDEIRGLRKARGAARAKRGGRSAEGNGGAQVDRDGARGRVEGARGGRRGAVCVADRDEGVDADETDLIMHGEIAR